MKKGNRIYCNAPSLLLPAVLIACVIFYFLMTLFTQPHIDDLKYTIDYRHWLLGEADFPGIRPWWEMVKAHFMGINGRLGDKLLIPFLWLPGWGKGLIAAFATVGFFWQAAAVAATDVRRHPYVSTSVILALVLCLPWQDTMFLGCMTVNYVIGLYFSMLALAIFFREESELKVERTISQPPVHSPQLYFRFLLALITGFLAGAWHECFTFIVAPGLLLYPLFVHRLSRQQWCVLIGGILGGLFIVCNPGFWVRYEGQMHAFSMKSWTLLFSYANFSLLLIPFYLAAVFLPRLRSLYTRRRLGIMTTCFLALLLNILIFISDLSLPRVMWFGIVMGIIGLAVFFSPWLRSILVSAGSPASVFCRQLCLPAYICR